MQKELLSNITTNKKKMGKALSVLIGLVDLYSKFGKPIGSQTLKDALFPALSPATIRNYLSNLEEMGYLKQTHTAGGREPTSKAISIYCKLLIEEIEKHGWTKTAPKELIDNLNRANVLFGYYKNKEANKKINLHSILESALFELTEMTGAIGALTIPHFEQDFVCRIKLIHLNVRQVIAILITQFGFVDTEVISIQRDLSEFEVNKIEKIINSKLTSAKTTNSQSKIENICKDIYSELCMRHLLKNNIYYGEKIVKTGLSQLTKSKFDQESLNDAITMFEDVNSMKSILGFIASSNSICTITDEDLFGFTGKNNVVSVLGSKYMLRNLTVGSVMLITSKKSFFKNTLFLLKIFQENINEALNKHVGKLKIDLKSCSESTSTKKKSLYNLIQTKETYDIRKQPFRISVRK